MYVCDPELLFPFPPPNPVSLPFLLFILFFFFLQSDVRTPKSTKHVHPIQWSQMKAEDKVKTVQLAIQTILPNAEVNPRSRSDSSKLEMHALQDKKPNISIAFSCVWKVVNF